MTHMDFVIAAYATFVIIWLGLIIDTAWRVWKARKHD